MDNECKRLLSYWYVGKRLDKEDETFNYFSNIFVDFSTLAFLNNVNEIKSGLITLTQSVTR